MTATAPVRFALYPQQDDFVNDDQRWVAFVGGRNSGKTYAGSVKAFLKATQPGLGIIAAPDFPMLRDGAYRQFRDCLNAVGLDCTENKNEGKLYIPDTGAEITFATLQTESRSRGPNYAWGWVDELDYLGNRDIWKALKGAIRAGAAPQLFATSTPKGRRLIYQEWVINATDRHALYRASSHDNPFVDAADYVASLGYDGQFYAQEIDAEFVAFEGLIYPRFERDTHVVATECGGWRTIIGVDVGARNPTAILVIRRSGSGQTHIEREVYRRGLSSDDIAALIAEAFDTSKAEAGYCDPSALAYIETLRRQGYPIHPANNDVMFGISSVTTALADGLTIDPSCIYTIDEFESYQWADKTTKDRPAKVNDHALDALRYAIVGDTASGDYTELDAYMARQLGRV